MTQKIGVRIPHKEVWKAFERYVINKWGKKHSMMGLELEKAIKKHIEEHEKGDFAADVQREKNNKLDDILLQGKKNGYYKQISADVLTQMVKKARGIVENRQAKKWVNTMVEQGYIQPVKNLSPGYSIYQILK